ncbi:MAG: hypothetical protein ABIR34_13950 [Marmoricola sp.]
METPVLIAGAVVVLIFLACVLAVVLRSRAESRRELVAAQAETAELHERLDRLAEVLERQSSTMIRVDDPAYVITDAGEPAREPNVPDRVVLSATMGEPLVKAVAFGHGLRRALSAESRNKIWFEVRREVRRARKQRRREMKLAWRRMHAEDRAAEASSADAA